MRLRPVTIRRLTNPPFETPPMIRLLLQRPTRVTLRLLLEQSNLTLARCCDALRGKVCG